MAPRQRIVTDGSWQAVDGRGPARRPVRRQRRSTCGCAIPASICPGHDTSGWVPVAVVPFDAAIIEPRMAPPVRIVAVIPVEPVTRPGGCIQYDGGQNISGFVRLRVRGRRGDTVTVRHAEVLEPDGSLHTRSLRSAKATDIYTLADDHETALEPVFTFHGFRYAEVETDADDPRGVASWPSAATRHGAGTSTCSEPRLERLHENVVWSQRDNFVSVPTDCPAARRALRLDR